MVEFVQERYGAEVATIHEDDEQIVEVVRCRNGQFNLVIHNRKPGGDMWDDMSATLSAADFVRLGEVVDAYRCQEEACPVFGQVASRSCKCHPRFDGREVSPKRDGRDD